MAQRVSQFVVEALITGNPASYVRVSQFSVERLVVYPKVGPWTAAGTTTVSITGTWLGGGAWSASGITSVSDSPVLYNHLFTPFDLWQSSLGETSSPDNTGPTTFVVTQRLGSYSLGGGDLLVVPQKQSTIAIPDLSGPLPVGGTLMIRPQVNTVSDPFTAKLGTALSKLRQFSFGVGGTYRTTWTTGSLEADGTSTMSITAVQLPGDGNWIKSTNTGVTSPFVRRAPNTEPINGSTYDLPNVSLTKAYLYYTLTQLFNIPRINFRSSQFIIGTHTDYSLTSIIDATSAWPNMSAFSGTLGTQTFNNSSFMVYSVLFKNATELFNGTLNLLGFDGDGETNVVINGSQVAQTDLTATGTSTCSIPTTIKVYNGAVNADGITAVAITGSQMFYGTFNMDGTTDVSFGEASIVSDSLEADGATDVEFTVIQQRYDSWEGDGKTDVAFSAIQSIAGLESITGNTDVAYTINETYTFGNTFNMDGATAVAITAQMVIGDNLFQYAGATTVAFANVQQLFNGTIEADGATDWTMDAVADYFIEIQFDGATAIDVGTSLHATVQILATGVGDSFYVALRGVFLYAEFDGQTDVAIGSIGEAEGLLEWFTGIGTEVSFDTDTSTGTHIEGDGVTTVSIDSAQDQHAQVVIDQIDQVMTIIGSFTNEATTDQFTTTTLGLNASSIVLGTNYTSGIIVNTKDTGVPDFAPGFTDSFTSGGVTSRGYGTGDLGTLNYKRVVGFSRPSSEYARSTKTMWTGEEYIRIPLFVNEAVTFPQISDTVGFTVSGISAIAGDGIVGNTISDYVTFQVLTNVRLSQNVMEVISTGHPNARVSQVCYEMLWVKTSAAFNSQTVAEILYLANIGVINQLGTETLHGGVGGDAVINQAAVEVIHSIKAATVVSQLTTEVLANGVPHVRSSQVVIECLIYDQPHLFALAEPQQVAIEGLSSGHSDGVIQLSAIEVIGNDNPTTVEFNQSTIEAVGTGNNRNGDINQTAVETLHNTDPVNAVAICVAVEMLVKAEYDPAASAMVNNPHYHM